jgi:hypothetical protein
MAIKYTKIFRSKTLQNLPKLVIFGLKTNHLVTLLLFRVVLKRIGVAPALVTRPNAGSDHLENKPGLPNFS